MIKRLIVAAGLCAAAALLPSTARAQAGPCRDPWVSQAVQEVQHRAALGAGEGGECNIQLYGGRWGSYAELKGYVQATFAALAQAGLEYQGAQGTALHDIRFLQVFPSAPVYVGARAAAPAGKNWVIQLGGGAVMAISRKCAPGYAASGGVSGGCVKGGVN